MQLWYCMYFYKVEYTVQLYIVLFKVACVVCTDVEIKRFEGSQNASKNFRKLFQFQFTAIFLHCYRLR